MKKTLILGLLAFASQMSQAEPPKDSNIAGDFFAKQNPRLTAREKRAMKLAEQWKANDTQATGTPPVAGRDGEIVFPYGSNQASVVCAVLQICDLSLQTGEQINSVNVGDSARWSIEPAISGSGDSEVQHLLIKPLDVGLETSLVVTTNRRSYHIQLRSHRTQFMPKISFSYPEEALAKLSVMRKREEQEVKRGTMPGTKEYLGALDFNYEIMGSPVWKPVRVYNDGTKTIIQMPQEMSQTEAPSLLLLKADGSFFSEPELAIVNYRLQSDRFIVDALFDRAVLISGVGSSQDKVTIIRKPR